MSVKLSKLRAEHEALLMRFVGVSDPLLKEQLGDDLVNLENEISILEVSIMAAEQEISKIEDEQDTEIIPDITHDEWNAGPIDDTNSWATAEELKMHADTLKKDLREFYEKQFIPADIITCIEKTNNIDLHSIIKKMRIRPPADLTQRKELCVLLDAINRQLIVLDYEGVIIETIGKDAPPIKLYCGCFTRFDESSNNTVY